MSEDGKDVGTEDSFSAIKRAIPFLVVTKVITFFSH
jgi:hypothetical protein